MFVIPAFFWRESRNNKNMDARQVISGMTEESHSRNLLVGIQEKQKHGCPTGNFGHDRKKVIPAKAGIPGPICHSRIFLAGIQSFQSFMDTGLRRYDLSCRDCRVTSRDLQVIRLSPNSPKSGAFGDRALQPRRFGTVTSRALQPSSEVIPEFSAFPCIRLYQRPTRKELQAP